MTEKTYRDPKIAINKVYTKTGDKGKTSLVGGQRVLKNHLRIEAYGSVDELGAHLGAAVVSLSQYGQTHPQIQNLIETLIRIQHELFNLGSILATLPEDVHPKQPRIKAEDVRQLERDIDQCNADLPLLRSFVLPGGCRANTDLHLCRTVCRRCERILITLSGETSSGQATPGETVRYLNRLSDAFFVWSRWVNQVLGHEEVQWQPNKAASARER